MDDVRSTSQRRKRPERPAGFQTDRLLPRAGVARTSRIDALPSQRSSRHRAEVVDYVPGTTGFRSPRRANERRVNDESAVRRAPGMDGAGEYRP